MAAMFRSSDPSAKAAKAAAKVAGFKAEQVRLKEDAAKRRAAAAARAAAGGAAAVDQPWLVGQGGRPAAR